MRQEKYAGERSQKLGVVWKPTAGRESRKEKNIPERKRRGHGQQVGMVNEGCEELERRMGN